MFHSRRDNNSSHITAQNSGQTMLTADGFIRRPGSAETSHGTSFTFELAKKPTLDMIGQRRIQPIAQGATEALLPQAEAAGDQDASIPEKPVLESNVEAFDTQNTVREKCHAVNATENNTTLKDAACDGQGASPAPDQPLPSAETKQDDEITLIEPNQPNHPMSSGSNRDATPSPSSCSPSQRLKDQRHDSRRGRVRKWRDISSPRLATRSGKVRDTLSNAPALTYDQIGSLLLQRKLSDQSERNQLSRALKRVSTELQAQAEENRRLSNARKALESELKTANATHQKFENVQDRLLKIQKGLKGWYGDIETLKRKRTSINQGVDSLKSMANDIKTNGVQAQAVFDQTKLKLEGILNLRDELRAGIAHNSDLRQQLVLQWARREDAERQLSDKRAGMTEERNSKVCYVLVANLFHLPLCVAMTLRESSHTTLLQ